MEKFNFEEWRRLAEENPAAFEEKRKKVIEDFISSFPPEKQKRLWEMQLLIDAERQMSKTPLEACQRIMDILTESAYKKGGLLDMSRYLTELELRLRMANNYLQVLKKEGG